MIISISETTELWKKALDEIQRKLDEPMMFDSFFSESYISDISGNIITIVVNSSLAAQLLQTKYYDIVSETVNELTESEFALKFIDSNEISKTITTLTSNTPKKSNYFEGCVVNPNLNFDNLTIQTYMKPQDNNDDISKYSKIINDYLWLPTSYDFIQ